MVPPALSFQRVIAAAISDRACRTSGRFARPMETSWSIRRHVRHQGDRHDFRIGGRQIHGGRSNSSRANRAEATPMVPFDLKAVVAAAVKLGPGPIDVGRGLAQPGFVRGRRALSASPRRRAMASV